MGFYYRKSKSFGPFRVNVSKSGVGYSVGGPGFRTGVSARGHRYTTFGLPGTGIGYRTSKGSNKHRASGGTGCMFAFTLIVIAGVGLVQVCVESMT